MSTLGPFAFKCRESVRINVADVVTSGDENAKLELAEKIFHNTTQGVSVTRSSNFDDFLAFYTGSSMRWETLGVFFTACGLCCNTISCDEEAFDFVGHRYEDRQNLVSDSPT